MLNVSKILGAQLSAEQLMMDLLLQFCLLLLLLMVMMVIVMMLLSLVHMSNGAMNMIRRGRMTTLSLVEVVRQDQMIVRPMLTYTLMSSPVHIEICTIKVSLSVPMMSWMLLLLMMVLLRQVTGVSLMLHLLRMLMLKLLLMRSK